MKQFIYGNTNGTISVSNITQTIWRLPIGLEESLTNVKGARINVRAPGTARNMRIRFDVPVPIGLTVTFIFEKNGVDTALACTVVAGQTETQNITDAIHCNVGDEVNWHIVVTGGTWPSTRVSTVIEYDSDTPNECWYGGCLGVLLGNQWSTVFHHNTREWWNITTQGGFAKDIVPMPGAITELYFAIGGISGADTPVGIGNTRSIAIWKNGVKQDGSGGTVDTVVTISGAIQLSNSKSFILPLTAGDRVWIDETLTGSPPAGQNGKYSIKWVSGIENQFPICTINNYILGPLYFPPVMEHDAQAGWVTNETLAFNVGPVTPMTIEGMIGAIDIPPGVGKTVIYPLRKNGVDAGLQLSFPDTTVGPVLATGTPTVITSADVWNLKKFQTGLANPAQNAVQAISFPGLTALPPPPPEPKGTIIVNKLVNPDNGETFQFNTINLTPLGFLLGNEQMQQFDEVPVGSGYSIVEVVPNGWEVTYEVNNGSPNTNITVTEDEIVIVNVTNRKIANVSSGIYKIVPGKRNDTLWLEDFVGTRNVRIP